MKTYEVIHKNSSAAMIVNANSDEEVEAIMADLLKNPEEWRYEEQPEIDFSFE